MLLGEQNKKLEGGHILVTVPGYMNSQLTARKVSIDLKHVKAVVYDEADEIFF